MLRAECLLLAGVLLLGIGNVHAQAPGGEPAAGPLNEEKPFAEAHILMQVSDDDPQRYQAVLDIANNLTKHYGGQDMVDIDRNTQPPRAKVAEDNVASTPHWPAAPTRLSRSSADAAAGRASIAVRSRITLIRRSFAGRRRRAPPRR